MTPQEYLDDWVGERDYFQGQIHVRQVHSILLPGEFTKFTKYLDGLKQHMTVIFSVETGKEHHKVHFQLIIVHDYSNRQTARNKFNPWITEQKLDGKAGEFGFLTKPMHNKYSVNVEYVLKDQKPDGYGKSWYVTPGTLDVDLLKQMCGLWQPITIKGTFEKKDQLCMECKKPTNYCHKVTADCIEYCKYAGVSKQGIAGYVLQRVKKDKARLPMHMIDEIVHALFLHFKLVDEEHLIDRIIERIDKK